MNNNPILIRLFNQLKPAILQGFTEPEVTDDTLRGLVQRLLRMYVTSHLHPDKGVQIAAIEVKNALARGGPRARRVAASDIAHSMELEQDREGSWRRWARPLFQQVWPMEVAYRDSETTWSLVTFVLAARDEFTDAVALVAPAMATLDRGLATWLSFHQGFKDTCDKYPRATVEFLYAITNRMAPPDDLGPWLDELIRLDTSLSADQNMQALQSAVRRSGA